MNAEIGYDSFWKLLLLNEEWHWVIELNWTETMVEVMKVMVTSLKRSHACTATVQAPTLQEATTDPHLRRRLPDTHRQIQSPVGSLFLSPGSWCTRFCCAFQEPISQSCVNSGSSIVGLMATYSKRAYAIPTPREKCSSKLEKKSETIISWLEKREIIIAP